MLNPIEFSNKQRVMRPQADTPEAEVTHFQELLKKYHGHRYRPRCGCNHDDRPLELVIRRLANGRFILARLPNEDASHREACDFYSADANRSGRAGYVDGVMEKTADGGYRVRLDLSLTIREAAPALAPVALHIGRAGVAGQRAMTSGL